MGLREGLRQVAKSSPPSTTTTTNHNNHNNHDNHNNHNNHSNDNHHDAGLLFIPGPAVAVRVRRGGLCKVGLPRALCSGMFAISLNTTHAVCTTPFEFIHDCCV